MKRHHYQTIIRSAVRVLLFCIVLELMLWGSGQYMAGTLNQSNPTLVNGQPVRILCIGDSITYMGNENSFPSLLQNYLNDQSPPGMTFEVINAGQPGMSTKSALERLEGYLDRYRPDIVLTLLGFSDHERNVAVTTMEYSAESKYVWMNFKLVRLLRYVFAKSWQRMLKDQERTPAHSDEAVQEQRVEQYFLKLQKVLLSNPNDCRLNQQAGDILYSQSKYAQAILYYEQMFNNCPSDNSDIRLHALQRLLDAQVNILNYDKAEQIINYIRSNYPAYTHYYNSWARLAFFTQRFDLARDIFLDRIQREPNLVGSYIAVARIYREQKEYDLAETYLKKSIQVDPDNMRTYVELGGFYMDVQRYTEAVEVFQQALMKEVDSYRDYFYRYLAECYTQMKQPIKALQAEQQLLSLQTKSQQNYREIHRRIKDKGLLHIALQYPLLKADALMHIFYPEKDVLVIENYENFMQAVEDKGYYNIFIDRDGNDFGHFTSQGAQLFASSLASRILEVVR